MAIFGNTSIYENVSIVGVTAACRPSAIHIAARGVEEVFIARDPVDLDIPYFIVHVPGTFSKVRRITRPG